jgi:CheY-like chemotaxis protein
MANLLLVEDDHDMADSCAELLRALGHVARVAHDGREGLAAVAEEPPDLILCDVEMPELDGPDMAYSLFLTDAGRERIPIVLTSGVPDLGRVARRVGTPYFIGKPFTCEQLVRALERALAERAPPIPRPPDS